MKILKIIGIVLVAIIALVWVGTLFISSETHVERSLTINAAPEAIFAEINNVKNFNNWSPWHSIDPNTEYTYEGPESGVDAKMSWTSDHQDVGSGSQWIVESVPNKLVKTNLVFEGFEDPAEANFVLEPEGDQTKVTWTFDTEMSGLYKYFGLVMDGMLGPQYEQGLQNLKAVAEAKPSYNIGIGVEEVPEIHYLSILHTMTSENSDQISTIMGELFGELMGYMSSNNIEMHGSAMTVYPRSEENSFDMECALPVEEEVQVSDDRIVFKTISSGKAVKAVHMGSYHLLEDTHNTVNQYISDQGLQAAGAPYEIYITDPSDEPDTSKWITQVYYPITN